MKTFLLGAIVLFTTSLGTLGSAPTKSAAAGCCGDGGSCCANCPSCCVSCCKANCCSGGTCCGNCPTCCK